MRYRAALTAITMTALVGTGLAGSAQAETAGQINFELPYVIGSINGQNGWTSTGSYDQEVVLSPRFTGFGNQSLRISNAFTSGGFGDQTFSPGLTVPAGESPALARFEATFDIGTTQDTLQPGLSMSVSPDNGAGSRMSYLRFEDQKQGVNVFFDDVKYPTSGRSNSATFKEKKIATLDRSIPHTVTFSIDFVTGPANDVVNVYIDDALRTTGTTWEDYYRYDPEQAGNDNVVPTVDRLLFRVSGAAAPDTAGDGFLIDNMTLASRS